MQQARIKKLAFFAPRSKGAKIRQQMRLIFAAAGIECYDVSTFNQDGRPILQEGTQLAICFAGDGTMLSLVNQVIEQDCILTGVNMGHLGFLSACSRGEAEELAHAIVSGCYGVEERIVLEIRQFNSEGICVKGPFCALNELSLTRAQTGKMIEVDVALDGVRFNRYYADGMLVATPTGSSAYSLAAGGPLIWPNSGVMCLTPICAHSLTNRSVVMPDTVEISLHPRERRGRTHETMIYSMDGRMVHQIKLQDTLVIRKSQRKLRLLNLEKGDYAARLRAKLGW